MSKRVQIQKRVEITMVRDDMLDIASTFELTDPIKKREIKTFLDQHKDYVTYEMSPYGITILRKTTIQWYEFLPNLLRAIKTIYGDDIEIINNTRLLPLEKPTTDPIEYLLILVFIDVVFILILSMLVGPATDPEIIPTVKWIINVIALINSITIAYCIYNAKPWNKFMKKK